MEVKLDNMLLSLFFLFFDDGFVELFIYSLFIHTNILCKVKG